MQPVFVGDVVTAMVATLGNTHAWGKTYELGGPQVYSWARSRACAPAGAATRARWSTCRWGWGGCRPCCSSACRAGP
ncbi:hypothetical protein WJ972_30745 [Achromobacter insuavis]